MSVIIRDMTEKDEYYVGTCTHVNENNIEFEDINVAEDQKAAVEMVEKSGQRGVPVLEVNGEIIVGFDQEAIEKALKKE